MNRRQLFKAAGATGAGLLLASAVQGVATADVERLPQAVADVEGNVLALAAVDNWLVVGGRFDRIGGVTAHNLAVLEADSGRVVWAGWIEGAVRALAVGHGQIYVGTDAGAFAMAVGTWTRTEWKGSPYRVRALAVDETRVYLGLSSQIRAVHPVSGNGKWTQRFRGGPVLALLSAFGRLYVGGMYEEIAGVTAHGLVALLPGSGGTVDPGFNAGLRPDSGGGPVGTDDGDCVLSLGADPDRQRVLVGTGGAVENSLRVLHPWTGQTYGHWNSEGDVQSVAYINGHDYFSGNHRSHGNSVGQPWTPWFGMMHDADAGWQESWDPGLSGDNMAYVGGDNHGGVNAALVHRGRLYLGGAFVLPVRGLAVY